MSTFKVQLAWKVCKDRFQCKRWQRGIDETNKLPTQDFWQQETKKYIRIGENA